MVDIHDTKFNIIRDWIWDRVEQGWDWADIRSLKKLDEEGIREKLEDNVIYNSWPPDITVELWYQIVDSTREVYEQRMELTPEFGGTVLTNENEDTPIQMPTRKNSSWVLYKEHLAANGWKHESIREIGKTTQGILRKLKQDTTGQEPVKGLVVGHVQSGKTANMAALMALAADNGWNMIIVLSGTIENLRQQTQSRLYNDLHKENSALKWNQLEHLSLNSPLNMRAQNLNFSDSSTDRFFTVCIKHSKRLEDLIKWLHADPKKLAQMKIIVIDDESDQGGVNTADISMDERSRINQLIVNLVEGKTHDGKPAESRPKAMNYIGYTATPYANFLNESGRESLYPKDFIWALNPPPEYFGPKQIFGIEGIEDSDGLDIIRIVDEDDLSATKEMHAGRINNIPETLLDAVAWFLCAASAMRHNGYKKPISMLIHTSQKQQHHLYVAKAVSGLFHESNREALLQRCRIVWIRETQRFSLEAFRYQHKTYPDKDKIADYPSFNDILPGIELLMSHISHIELDQDQMLTYHSGIHLCIDNCANNGIFDENTFVRLAYPEPSTKPYPSPAPAFIVVGGSTLSRGLTIEGLVSTYFLRPASQADSLMQMGRWFGYRRGYELYPRIWMTAKTVSQFKFLARLEHDLREDLKRFMYAGAKPSEYGPRVRAVPGTLKLKLTSANKMQNAIPAEIDFSGINIQTVVFSENKDWLEHNIAVADAFLNTLGNGQKSRSGESMIWRGVPFEKIKKGLLLDQYKFHERASVFNQLETFCDWYAMSAEKAGYTDWNVIVSGTKLERLASKKLWVVPGGKVGKINRSRLKKLTLNDDYVNIGVLRAPKDLYEDLESAPKEIKADNKTVNEIREKAGLGRTPLLIMYRIDKDSKAPNSTRNNSTTNREDLNVPADIIGISIWLPGTRTKSLVQTLTVKIDSIIDDDMGDISED